MTKDAIRLTFTHRVTRDELVSSLDRILKINGCPGCGLNGWGGFVFQGDPEPLISQLRHDLTNEKISNVLRIETSAIPSVEARSLGNLKEAL